MLATAALLEARGSRRDALLEACAGGTLIIALAHQEAGGGIDSVDVTLSRDPSADTRLTNVNAEIVGLGGGPAQIAGLLVLVGDLVAELAQVLLDGAELLLLR